MNKFFLFVIALTLTGVTTHAQITITVSDLQSFIVPGNSIYTDTATLFGTVNVGTAASTAQTFDLSGATFIPEYAVNIIPVSQTPLGSYFSNLGATFALTNGTLNNESYSYGAFSGDSLIGIGKYGNGTNDTAVYSPHDIQFQCPLTLGSQWTSIYSDILHPGSHGDTTTYKVDAFGTLKLPSATLDCIRLVSNARSGKNMSYVFMTKENVFAVVVINKSDSGKATVTPKSVGTTAYAPTSAVGEPRALPLSDLALQLYPSPLVGTKSVLGIAYSLPQESNVAIELVNTYGEVVSRLANGVQGAGAHQISTHISDLPAGYYFCRIIAGTKTAVAPVVITE